MTTPEDIRRLALALPEAEEASHFDSASFRVRKKIFATLSGDPAAGFVVKLDPEDQHNLVAGEPEVYSPVSGYFGRNGWTRVDARRLSETQVRGLMLMAWRMVAPKALVKQSSPDP